MAFDRQGTGLAVIRISVGIFFIVKGLIKYHWFIDSSILAARLHEWLQASATGSASRWYLEHLALPGLTVFTRLVPLGEISCGLALLVGFWTPLFAFIAFLIALNYQLASGQLADFRFLTNSYGLSLLASTLGLALGGKRLPWSIRG